MQDKIDTATQVMAHSGGALSTLSGLWMWLGQNHNQIAVIGIIFGMVLGCAGAIVNVIHKRKVERILRQHYPSDSE